MTHPFEKLVEKCGQTKESTCSKMAEIKAALKGHKKGITCSEQEYNEILNNLTKTYKNSYYKYITGITKTGPELETLVIIARALRCTLDEVTRAFYPKYFSFDWSSEQDEQIENTEAIIQTQTLESNQKKREQNIIIIKKQYGYKILENYHKAEYIKGSTNTLNMTKSIKLQVLEDYIEVIENFDYYKCVRNNNQVLVDYSKDILSIDRKKHFGSDDNSVSLIFHKPLMQDQVVEFFLNYFYQDVLDRDIGFHYAWTLHPTEKLILEVAPPEPRLNCAAKYREHRFKGCPLGVEEELASKSKEVFLKEESVSYIKIISDPQLMTTCGFYWDREYW